MELNILILYISRGFVRRNMMSTGIKITGCKDVTVTDNKVRGYDNGIVINESEEILFKNNDIILSFKSQIENLSQDIKVIIEQEQLSADQESNIIQELNNVSNALENKTVSKSFLDKTLKSVELLLSGFNKSKLIYVKILAFRQIVMEIMEKLGEAIP